MKSLRHSRILDIIQSNIIETQEQLADCLKQVGIEATQATISRDIKELRLQKILTSDGRYRYSAMTKDSEPNLDSRLINIFREGVVSVDSAGNIVVLKTLSALAPAACSAVDSMRLESVVGTLAGDDTAIMIIRDEDSTQAFCAKALKLMKSK